MKLNSECIRGLLLSIEEICDFDTLWEYQQDDFESEFLAEYTHDEILYHIRQAEKAKLIEDVHYYNGGSHATIRDLTPKGHEFLANIRNDSIWKKVISKAPDASLPVLFELAKDFAVKYFLG